MIEDAGEHRVTWADVKTYGHTHRFGFLAEHEGREGWRRLAVEVSQLRDMHGEYGRDGVRVGLEKGRRFVVLFSRLRARIDDGDFPEVEDITREWKDKPAIIVQRTPHNGALYVADGEKRTFNALYNGESTIDAFVIDIDEERDVLE